MIFESILTGLTLLRLWQVWVIVSLYTAGTFFYLLRIQPFLEKFPSLYREGSVFGLFSLGGPMFEGVMISFFIAFLSIILLGGSTSDALTWIIVNFWRILLWGVVLGGFTLLPIIAMPVLMSGFIGDRITKYLLCVLIFRILTASSLSGFKHENPSLITSSLYLLIGLLVVHVIYLLFQAIVPKSNQKVKTVLIPAFDLLGALVPFLMYSSHILLSIQKGTSN